jgi:hypothetical protein
MNHTFLVLCKYILHYSLFALFIPGVLFFIHLHSLVFVKIEIRPEVPSLPSHILPGIDIITRGWRGEREVTLHSVLVSRLLKSS